MFELYVLRRVLRTWLSSRADLVAENLLLRHKLAVLSRLGRKRPPLRIRDKVVWILARRLCWDWRRHRVLVRPETVIHWHRRGWRLFWWWRCRCPVGRPRLSADVRELIGRIARENLTWGTERICGELLKGELLKLDIVVSNRSIRRYRGKKPPRPPSQSWRTFLANRRSEIWAADLFTVRTLTFKTLYVLLFIAHDRRELVHWNVTPSLTAAWVWRQLLPTTPCGHQPRYLLRDRDTVYGGDSATRARHLGIETLLTPGRAPRANAVAERVVGTLRRECLDHLIVMYARHLQAVLREFVAYYNADRPHRGLGLDLPQPVAQPGTGRVRSRPILGGLHYMYECAA